LLLRLLLQLHEPQRRRRCARLRASESVWVTAPRRQRRCAQNVGVARRELRVLRLLPHPPLLGVALLQRCLLLLRPAREHRGRLHHDLVRSTAISAAYTFVSYRCIMCAMHLVCNGAMACCYKYSAAQHAPPEALCQPMAAATQL
jgi:hypothetical protein